MAELSTNSGLNIVEDGFYFRGFNFINLSQKRNTWHVGFLGKLSNIHWVVKYIQIM